jgi:hypothetical protein
LKGWLSRSSNELRYQAAKWGSTHSYRQAAAILQELLPVDWKFGHVDVRDAVLKAGARLEKEPTLPATSRRGMVDPGGTPVCLAFDGGYARRVRKGRPRNFEILTGAVQTHRKIRVFATAYASRHGLPQRLRRFIASAGVEDTANVNLMTDGAGSLLRLQRMLPMKTRFVLDYFHVAMKLRHIDQCVGRIPPCQLTPGGSIFELYDRSNYLRAYVWTGRRDKVEASMHRLTWLLDQVAELSPDDARTAHMALGHVADLADYLRQNAAGIVNYQSWKRRGWRISTSGVEATVNRLIGRRLGKAQQMCWSKRGAHLLLQVRCALLNEQLLPVFQRWHWEVGEHRTKLPYEWVPQHS